MEALGWWLMLVGSLRLVSLWLGFFDAWALRHAFFSYTTIHGWKSGVWTLLTCTLLYLCAFILENQPLYFATFLSFIYAFGHFLTEYLIYKTKAITNLTTIGSFAETEVHRRTFGVWTLLTCTLCYLCAFNLENRPLYLATFLSFIYAFGYFLTEYLIYETMAIPNLTTVGFLAGTTIIWMLLLWNAHQPVHPKDS